MNEYDRVQKFSQMHEQDDGWSNREMRGLMEGSWNDTRDLLGTHTPEMERVAAQLREKEGNYSEAIRYHKEIISSDPMHAESLRKIAELSAQVGEWSKLSPVYPP